MQLNIFRVALVAGLWALDIVLLLALVNAVKKREIGTRGGVVKKIETSLLFWFTVALGFLIFLGLSLFLIALGLGLIPGLVL